MKGNFASCLVVLVLACTESALLAADTPQPVVGAN
jgi:hypothetical protein